MKCTELFVIVLFVLLTNSTDAQVTFTFQRKQKEYVDGKENSEIKPVVPNTKVLTSRDVQAQVDEFFSNQINLPKINVPTPGVLPETHVLSIQKQHQVVDVHAMMNEMESGMHQIRLAERKREMMYFKEAFEVLMAMRGESGKFSLKDAVFAIENAYLGKTLSYTEYTSQIKSTVDIIKLQIEKEGLDPKSDLVKNYIIQQMYSNSSEVKNDVHKTYSYDFNDFWGEQNWSKMFVTKLLKTHSGQCHSLPLLYIILAEEMEAKAWMALAPQHAYIVFESDKGLINFETTNGHLVDDEWVMKSGFITTNSIKNKIYMDTLSQEGLFSTVLADLIMGYTEKFGYDRFMASMTDSLLQIQPNSIPGNIFKADLYWITFLTEAEKVGNPPIEEIDRYPAMRKAYSLCKQQRDIISRLGYVDIPRDRYTDWLNSARKISGETTNDINKEDED